MTEHTIEIQSSETGLTIARYEFVPNKYTSLQDGVDYLIHHIVKPKVVFKVFIDRKVNPNVKASI